MTGRTIEEKRRALLDLRLRQRRAERTERAEQDRIVPVSREGRLPLSFQQQGLWFLSRFAPEQSVYNVPFAVRLRGELDTAALRAALLGVVARHESLRTRYLEADGEPYLVIDPAPDEWVLPVHDLVDLPEGERDAEVVALTEEEARRPFDLESGPVMRTTLVRIADDDHVLMLTLPHIATDGWSANVLADELAALYAGQEADTLPELPTQPADFAAWQHRRLAGAEMREQLDYWRRRLDGLPVVDFPTDRSRPVVPTWAGAYLEAELPAELGVALRELARSSGVSLLAVLQAGFLTVLSRYTGQDDLAVGSVFSGRTRSEVEPLVGLFANTVVLRTSTAGNPTFAELVERCQETVLGALAHQDAPFGMVVDAVRPERDPGRNPLFQISLTLQTAGTSGRGFRFEGLETEPLPYRGSGSRFDLGLTLAETPSGRFDISVEYSTELFDRVRMERLVGHFRGVLERAVEAPGSAVGGLGLLGVVEREQVLSGWNPVAVGRAEDGLLLHGLVERWAGERPDGVAVRFEGGELSFGELDLRANRLAHLIRGVGGVGPDGVVAVLLDRGLDLPVALLGVLKSGGAWLPLDPQNPVERLEAQLVDAGVRLVVTCEALEGLLPAGVPRLVLEREAGRLGGLPGVAPVVETCADHLAYVIYTSGSTGVPKGVMVSHRSAVGFVCNARELFGLGVGDRVLQFANPAFDVSVFDFFGAWGSGAAVVGAPREVLLDPVALGELLRRERVTVADVPPAVLRLLDPVPLVDLRALFVGLEAFPAELVNRWVGPGRAFHNGYGPTEATVACVDYACPVGGVVASPPIGRAMANHRVYVLDGGLEPVPVGVAGELFVAGVGLARGYVGRADLTAERFVPDPFSGSGGRMYRTGDVVRWREDGNLEFLGRADRQVKIRGLRIELGEVEHALSRVDGVRQCAVVVREPGTPGAWLSGYVVPEPGVVLDGARVRSVVLDRLPLHMVPSQVVVLEALPLTANGKVDQARLPEPVARAREAYAAPVTGTECGLARIWHELLDVPVERISVHDSFFDLGGNSLQATRLLSRIRDLFGARIDLRQVFTDSELRPLAARIDASGRRAEPTQELAALAPSSGPWPLSYQQEGLWFLHQVDPDSPVYNVSYPLRLRGALDLGALRRALTGLVDRHEVLRSRFVTAAHGGPEQVVDASPEELPASVERVADLEEALRLAEEEASRPFDLAAAPAFRTRLFRLAEDDHVLLLTMHHMVTDGWSGGLVSAELAALYEGRDLPELALQVRDFAAWQRRGPAREELGRQLEYWRRTLDGLPVVDFPSDRPRPVAPTWAGAQLEAELPADLTTALAALARSERVSPLAVLQAAFLTVLARYTGQDDLAIGSVFSGRTRVEVEQLVGFFANTVVLRTSTAGNPTFRELVARCQETVVGALAHQDAPFGMVVDALRARRDPARNPLFQISLSLQSAGTGGETFRLRGTEVEELATAGTRSRFDLSMTAIPAADGRTRLQLEFATELFDRARMVRLVDHFREVLGQAVREPGTPLDAFDLLTRAERKQLAATGDAVADFPSDTSLYGLFEEQVRRRPDAVAVVDGGQSTTYRELHERACRTAARLRAGGVRRGDVVGLCGARSVALVAGILGILRAGGAYLPLDPGYPAERLSFMLDDAAVKVVLADPDAELPAGDFLRLPLTPDPAEGAPDTRPVAVGGRDLAYLIYTSGSTGRPKAVMVPQGNVVRLLRASEELFRFSPQDVWTFFHSFAFDFSVWELWGALAHGGRLVVVPYWDSRSPEAFHSLLRKEQVTVLSQTPAAFRQLVAADEKAEAELALRLVIFGGDALDTESVLRWFDRHGEDRTQLVNMYGITETTVHVTHCRLSRELLAAGGSPIGRPLPDLAVRVVDRAGRLAPVGVPGEMWVGGPGVAWGYLGRPELTAERFVPDPFSGGMGRLYRSGDLARWLPDGTLDYLGRVDQQVKIRGFRIEPGEIEAALLAHPDVVDCCVGVAGSGDARRLVGYVVPGPGIGADLPTRLRGHLSTLVPDHLVPSVIMPIGRIPLTANGKVDRAALPAPSLAESAEPVPPRTATERSLAGLWAEVLQLEAAADRIGVQDGFFDLGGSSLDLVRLRTAIQREFGVQLDVRGLYAAPTVAAMAEAVDGHRLLTGPLPDEVSPLVELRARGGRPPLFLVHAVGGSVAPYVSLTRLLDPDQPVYGLEDPGLHGGRSAEEIGQAAERYLAAIRTVRPNGPYHLGGWSFGGTVALEMAARLRAEGEEVPLVLLLDTGAPLPSGPVPDEAELLLAYVADLAGLEGAAVPDLDPADLRGLPSSERVDRVLSVLERAGLIPVGIRADAGTRITAFMANSRSLHRHRGTPYDGTITLLSAEAELDGEVGRWRALAPGGLRHHVVPGTHHTMLQHPNLRVLANRIQQCLDEGVRRDIDE
ncbi:non-ribosomal peptide synthetase [Kitasatospora brasiliensis]|uniref:non-ribosomal peptide synthetase n=1 Tax=Kitasatospora brasiliensis TaxID=3058040 RepID=UPI002930D864|nr:non-ribosomal peptide synthetase [Kitasatospora sp. K002]